MFQQHFQTDQAQNQAAGAGSVTPETFSQFETDRAAQKGNEKSDDADQQGTGPDVYVQYGKADAYRQRVDAGAGQPASRS